MPRSDLFLKIEIEHDDHERPDRRGEEICRAVRKMHGVRSAEVSSWVAKEPETDGVHPAS